MNIEVNSLATHKSLLRQEMKSRRAALAMAAPYAGDELAEVVSATLTQNALWPDTDAVIAGYWPIQSEINPLALLQMFEERGNRLAMPCLDAAGDTYSMIFRSFRLGDELVNGPFGIRQPDEMADEILPDVILLPLLAFDARGWRLGYGGGYYDRMLARLQAQKQIRAYGVAFSEQQLDEIPFEVHDQPLDGVFTNQGVIMTRSNL
ncbi:MAG: 5-formyltetrahydrofolate cyclo-ligase [Asticcacaulis sp.]